MSRFLVFLPAVMGLLLLGGCERSGDVTHPEHPAPPPPSTAVRQTTPWQAAGEHDGTDSPRPVMVPGDDE